MDASVAQGILVRIRTFTHAMQDRMRHHAPPGLGMPHLLVMKALIVEGPMAQGHLAERLGISKGSASQTVSTLVDAGLVVRRRDPNDARIHIIAPTAQAESMRRDIEAQMADLFADLFADWSDDDAARMMAMLDGLIERVAVHPNEP